MPIVSTYTRTDGNISGFTPGSSGLLSSSRQKLPYVNAPYSTTKMFIEPNSPVSARETSVKPYIYNALFHDNMTPAYVEREAVQLARSRLNKTLIQGRAALGITAATANQSFGMIATRTSQIVKAFKAARKGNVRALARSLGVKPKKKISEYTAKDPAALWLEFTFGWSPLVSDIGQAVVVLSDPFEVHRSFGTATVTRTGSWPGRSSRAMVQKKARAVCTAGLRIDNPNVALMTQLGLSNPAAVVWDIIPFSFVVDWFIKINRFVNTWNDMAGFSYVDPVTTIETKVFGYLEVDRYFSHPAYVSHGRGRKRVRTLGIVNKPVYPSFTLPTPNLWLAATSTALAVQIFKK